MGQRSDEMSRDDLSDDSMRSEDAIPYSSAGSGTTENADETAEIRAGIDETRAEMSETIEAIQERLSPQHLKEQVKEQVRDATIGKAEDMMRNAGETLTEARYGLMETIRQNPIPAALVGVGLGWLFMNRRSGAPRAYSRYSDQGRYYRGGQPYDARERGYASGASYYAAGAYDYDDMADQRRGGVKGAMHRAQETAGSVLDRAQETVGNIADRTQEALGGAVDQAQQTASNLASQAQGTASNIAGQTQEAVEYMADRAQYQVQRVEDRFQQALYENPLSVAAAALAIGAMVGLSLPQTQRENELLGEARDNLIDRAQEVAQDTLEKVQQVAGDVIDQAQTTVQEKAKERGLTAE